jgi:hypothetical protein
MEIVCYEVTPGNVELRPAPRRRGWMDATPHAFAYHCLPLVIANLHGWEMLCPIDCEVTWNGGPGLADLEIATSDADATARPAFAKSHFGSGILTFAPPVIMRTPPGLNLWVTGPINSFKDGIQAMSASIETDWLPHTFSINWKLTRPGLRVSFAKGEPFCAFFPITRGLVAACEPRLQPLESDPELAAAYRWAGARRELDELLAIREKDAYQGWYTDGVMPNPAKGRGPADHETKIVARPFKRGG